MQLLNDDITGVDLGLNFVYTMYVFDKQYDVELAPNGKNVFVNESNKK